MKLRKTTGKGPSAARELAIKEAILAYADGAFAEGDRLVELYAWLESFTEFETIPIALVIGKGEA